MKTICLNMIVRNETAVLRRCLASVAPLIDHWVIVDTGSNDGTQDLIRSLLGHLPGTLYERPWVHFGHNRNEALALARANADYLLFIDADETLSPLSLDKSALDADFYQIEILDYSSTFYRTFLISSDPGWFWEGVIHEYPLHKRPQQGQTLFGAHIDSRPRDGARARDPQKYRRDIQCLQQELAKDPSNSRNAYYLAQCYGCAQDKPNALLAFQQRATLGGDTQELFWTLYSIGCLQQDLHHCPDTVIASYTRAHLYDPSRAEPLYRLANLFTQLGCHTLAYLLARSYADMPRPATFIRAALSIYDYAFLLTLAETAHAFGRLDESLAHFRRVLTRGALPAALRKTVEANIASLELYFAIKEKEEAARV